MSFRLRIDSVEVLGAETLISGWLLEGAYFGPQYVRLKDTTGNERTTTILSHGLIDAEGWPVMADHSTQLQLYPSGLLVVPMCYLPRPDTQLTERLATLCARIRGANPKFAPAMAANMVERQVVPNATWKRKPLFGWCSNWQYSQRNPASPMSVLTQAEFSLIDQFFSEEG